MQLQEEDPDTFIVKQLFTYPDEHHYMGQLFFGSQRAPANVTFDTGSSFTVVTSDMCSNCASEVYIPGRSDTVIDKENSWQLSYPHDGNMKLNVHEYQDTVCLSQSSGCVENFPVYVIFSQSGMYSHSDGIVGIAPVPAGTSTKDSLVLQMVKQGLINNGIVSFYYSKYPDEIPSSILIGDLDESVVEGGANGIQFFDILEDNDWQVEITQGFFGSTILFHHTFLPAVVYSGATFLGIMDRDFKQLSNILKTLDKSIYCNEVNCFGKYSCDYYDDVTPDYTLTIGHTNFTIAGRDLFEHPGDTGGCQFALYNSGQQYILGEFFLQNFYSVYDVKNCKIGLGKVIDIHAPVPAPPST